MRTSFSSVKKPVPSDQFRQSSNADAPAVKRLFWAVFTLVLGVILIAPNSSVVVHAKTKPPEVEVLDTQLHRETDLITVDTTLKNISEKPIRSLTAIYQFFDANHNPISTQRTVVDEPALAPGAESSILAQLPALPRAVAVEVSAVGDGGRELRVKNPGPFRIE